MAKQKKTAPKFIELTNKEDQKQVLKLPFEHAKDFLLLEKSQHRDRYQVSTEGWTFDYKNKDFVKKSK